MPRIAARASRWAEPSDARRRHVQRLLEADAQPVLISASDQGDACRGAHRRIRVRLKEPGAVGREAIDVRRAEIAPAIARNVGVAEIVGEDENDIRPTGGAGGGK